MKYYTDLSKEGFSPDEYEDIKLCLETLLSVREGSQPMDRDFGINLDEVTSYPLDVAENMLSLEIIEKVERYEPRVSVESVEFDSNTDGQLAPFIHFVKAEVGA